MATEVKIEESMGIDRCVMQTITQQSLEGPIDKNSDARSYREDHTDGVYTLVEEVFISQGDDQFSFDGTMGTEPLETHPIFNKNGAWVISEDLKKKWTTYKRNPTDPYLAGKGIGKSTENLLNLWQPAEELDSNFIKFYEYIRAGVESYYVGRVTIRVTRLEAGAPNMSNLGRIDSYPWPEGFQPPGGENANYLLSGVRSQQEGAFFRTTYEYMSSAAKSEWDAALYLFS
jgi:hypothetical protein